MVKSKEASMLFCHLEKL